MRTVRIRSGHELKCDEADFPRLVQFQDQWVFDGWGFPYLPDLRTGADQLVMFGVCESINGVLTDLRRCNLRFRQDRFPFQAMFGRRITGTSRKSKVRLLREQWMRGGEPGVRWNPELGVWQFRLVGTDGVTVVVDEQFQEQAGADEFARRHKFTFHKLLGC